MAKDYIRFCKTCGHQWRVSKAVARLGKGPNGMEMTGRKMMAAGSSMTLGSSQRAVNQLRLGNAESRAQMVAATSQCPECGSGKYTQVPEGWQSREEERRRAAKAAKKRDKERKAQQRAAEKQKARTNKAAQPPAAPTVQSQRPAAPPPPSVAGPIVPPPPGTPQGWLPDPTGRHELRWWTGTGYAANVSDGGKTSLDMI